MNGAQALFKALVNAGLNTCFTNPGTSEMQLVYEMGLTEDVRPVLCLQENTATGAADGYARMAGKPAFTLLHVGAGFANGIANVHRCEGDDTENEQGAEQERRHRQEHLHSWIQYHDKSKRQANNEHTFLVPAKSAMWR